MKKIILMSVLSLWGASLSSMGPFFTQEERNLLTEAREDDAKAIKFADYIAAHCIDVDTMLMHAGCSVGRDLSFWLKMENGTFFPGQAIDVAKTERVEKLIYPKIEQHRSCPPGVKKLRAHIAAALQDDAQVVPLKAFLQGRFFNIDLITYDPVSKAETIAQKLEYCVAHEPAQAARAQALLKLPEIKKFRIDKDAIVGTLFKAFEKDSARIRDLEVWIKKYSLDVDFITYDAFTTVGDAIDDLVSKASAKDAVHDIAWLVRPYRTAQMREFRNLLKDYVADGTKFPQLKKWFTENPFDVDGVANHPGDPKGETIGSYINALKQDLKGPVAELVRPYRQAELKTFRDLLVDYEINYIKKEPFQKLKKWFAAHPFDIDAVAFNPTKPDGETLGDKINTLMLEDSSLGAIFNEKRSKPVSLSRPSWLSGRNIALSLAAVTVIGLYAWYRHSVAQNTQEEEDTRAEVA